jgi:hypothetical protein
MQHWRGNSFAALMDAVAEGLVRLDFAVKEQLPHFATDLWTRHESWNTR